MAEVDGEAKVAAEVRALEMAALAGLLVPAQQISVVQRLAAAAADGVLLAAGPRSLAITQLSMVLALAERALTSMGAQSLGAAAHQVPLVFMEQSRDLQNQHTSYW